jgi:transposase
MSFAGTPTMRRVRHGRSGSTPGWSVRINMPPGPATCRRPTSTRRSSPPPRSAQGAEPNDTKSDAKPPQEALGRSRGGLTTKIHLAADTRCRPISRITTAGHRHDCLAFESVMAGIRIHRTGRGRPRTRPDRVLGDKAYSNRAIRSHLRRRQIKATIPEPTSQQAHRLRRGRKGGRPPQFDAEIYQQRNVVERAINKLKGYRAVASRYDNGTTCTAEPSTSPRSGSGSATPSHDPRDRL